MNIINPDKPKPTITRESAPYWDGLKAHRLMLQRCSGCKVPRHYPRPMCASCFSLNHEWFEASGRGHVHSWVISHHAFHAGFKAETPYVLLTVDLLEGVRMVAPLLDSDGSPLSLGTSVVLDYEDVNADLTLPRFRIHE